jgi:hypothetical protein
VGGGEIEDGNYLLKKLFKNKITPISLISLARNTQLTNPSPTSHPSPLHLHLSKFIHCPLNKIATCVGEVEEIRNNSSHLIQFHYSRHFPNGGACMQRRSAIWR